MRVANRALTRLYRVALVLVAATVAIWPAVADADAMERKASWLGTEIATDGTRLRDANQIFDDEILKAIQKQLGGKYQNLQLVVSACYSGGFVDPVITKILGDANWSISAATTLEKQENFTAANVEKLKPDGPPGLKITDNLYFHGWGPQWIRKLASDANATSSQLADFATANQIDEPKYVSPKQFAFKGTGDQSKIRDGTDDSRMVFWQSGLDIILGRKKHVGFSAKAYETFRTRGYTDEKIDFALEDFKGADINGANTFAGGPMKPDRNASRDELFKQIEDLGAQLTPAANPPKKKALLWLRAHGNVETRKAELRNGYLEGLALQGQQYDATHSALSLSLPTDLVQTFFEGHGTDDPALDKYGRPTFLLTTVEESPDLGPVGVSINGVPIGQILMQGSSQGGNYSLPLDEVALNSLLASNSFVSNNYLADVAFSFASGSFRVATEWDFLLGELPHWGVGLTGPALATAPVPEPRGLFLIVGSCPLWLQLGRRRSVGGNRPGAGRPGRPLISTSSATWRRALCADAGRRAAG